ncbi:H(+)/Cl(-) exchange transporter 7-like [Lycorma delicatula]|uniref:H(+)/Cl(-) exchange transporter 7-like n=1 Tax=Lycorma delicatula TaxID=130591 RepID=UPI003F517D63
MYSRHPGVSDIQFVISEMTQRNTDVSFCWIPSHIGISGGFLFSVEESVSFLSTKLLFKIFLSTIFTVITVTYLFTAYTYHIIGDKINNKKFFYLGKLADKETNYNLLELPAFVLLGTIAGLVGALFVFFQKWLIALRQKYLTTKIRQMLEGFFVVVVTTTVQVSLTYLCDSCVEVEEPQYAVKLPEPPQDTTSEDE